MHRLLAWVDDVAQMRKRPVEDSFSTISTPCYQLASTTSRHQPLNAYINKTYKNQQNLNLKKYKSTDNNYTKPHVN